MANNSLNGVLVGSVDPVYQVEKTHFFGGITADVQSQHEQAELALTLWNWFVLRGKRYVTLPELAQSGPFKLRKAQTLRSLIDVLAAHYLVRRVPEWVVEYAGKARREAWELRL